MNRAYRKCASLVATLCATGMLSGCGQKEEKAFGVTHLGLSETTHRRKIMLMLRLDPAVTPWCAAFVTYKERSLGRKGTGSLVAKSYLNYGTRTEDPRRGDIVVLSRGKESWQGHVGYFISKDKDNVYIYGGNQDDEINITPYPLSRVVQYRRPPEG